MQEIKLTVSNAKAGGCVSNIQHDLVLASTREKPRCLGYSPAE